MALPNHRKMNFLDSAIFDRNYIVLRSAQGCKALYTLKFTLSDPYDTKSVKNYDHVLHQMLSKIFSECSLTRDQINKLTCAAPKNPTNKNSIFKLIMERKPSLGKLLQKRKKLSLLWIAMLSCYQHSAELLVRSGADVNEIYGLPVVCDRHRQLDLDEKSSVLHALVRMYPSSWNERFIALIIDHGADLKARDSLNNTALYLAVKNGRVKVTEMLLEKGADVNAVCHDSMTPLLEAVRTGEADELVPLLMKHGADLTARDKKGRNALYYLAIAPWVENVNLARVLIENGVSPRETETGLSQSKKHPIHAAVCRGKIELVKLFLDHGANVNAREFNEKFPLYVAATQCEDTECEAMLLTLLKRGANINLTAMDGYTVLHGIIMDSRWDDGKKLEKTKLLLSVGADMFATAHYYSTPFDIICQRDIEFMDDPRIGLMLKTLALKKACMQPSMKLKGENSVKMYQTTWNCYQNCIEEIDTTKTTKFIKSCSFFDLLTKCHCQIAPLMRNRNFESEFGLYDLSVFSLYAEDILEAFERAKSYYHYGLEQENLINEAVYNILPDLIVRKVACYALNCETCEMKKIVKEASRYHSYLYIPN